MITQKYEDLIKSDKYQVFLFTSRAHLPFSFFSHSWFVINKHGLVSRWETLFTKNRDKNWGHLFLNANPPFEGLGIMPFKAKNTWIGELSGFLEGDEAKKMIDFIEYSKKSYPYIHEYLLFGPNSNTYIQWILKSFPEFPAKLPSSAIGKNYIHRDS
jgi:hypothetical protein